MARWLEPLGQPSHRTKAYTHVLLDCVGPLVHVSRAVHPSAEVFRVPFSGLRE